MNESFIADCGHEIPALPVGHCGGTGFGRDEAGKTSCYACCAELERAAMVKTGRATLYLTDSTGGALDDYAARDRMRITDWPGKLSFHVMDYRKSHGYGFGRKYPIVTGHFIGPDAYVWAFRNAGDMQIARCKRTKLRWVKQPHGGYAAE